jgi:hypothetical protein
MKHLMIDLETMGTRVNCPVVAIGACYFDPETGRIGDTFDGAIDVADAMRLGSADGSTIKWWLQQSQEAREKVIRGRHSAELVFGKFYDFCVKGGDDIIPWGNGSSFDISILDYAIPKILGKPVPWKFWNVRDCRTIKALAEGVVPYTGKLAGTAHTALDDAKHQAEWVSVYWQGLRGPKGGEKTLTLDL